MKLLSMASLAALSAGVFGEDLLFLSNFEGLEVSEAAALGFTTKTVTEDEWRAMTTEEFASYKAIIVGDQFCHTSQPELQPFVDTKDTWGPAVTGNIIIIGTNLARRRIQTTG
jgi:hypothetical protein